MSEVPNYTTLSISSIPLEMILFETKATLATATGFFYLYKGHYYLITNWHNFSGLNNETKEAIGNHAGRPDMLRYPLFIIKDGQLIWNYFQTPLYEDEDCTKPYWLIHPAFGEQVDVVALRVAFSHPYTCIPVNEEQNGLKNFSPKISDDVFILGYPYNIRQLGIFPIWKKGSIASEPEFDFNNMPLILVDTATRKGMSGSPVICQRNSIWQGKDASIGVRRCFIGVYSGRMPGETEFEAQLGRVWKAKLIEEIIDGGRRDDLDSFARR